MICPCCGESREINSSECASCGAKQVGPPLAKPDVLMPKLGPSFAALACGVMVIIAFLLAWIFIHDAKVGRVLLVWTLGDGYKLTKDLLNADSHLPYYRIFAFDAYRLAGLFSIGAIPLSLAGVWLAIAYLRTRSLWFPLGLHWAWNWTQASVFGLPVSGIVRLAPAPLLHAMNKGPDWLTGGAYGIEGGAACTVALLISTFVVWRTKLISSADATIDRLDAEDVSNRA